MQVWYRFWLLKSRFWWAQNGPFEHFAKIRNSVFRWFSVVTARDDFILIQVARTMLYLGRLRAIVLKCGFDVDFGCWKVDYDGPKMAYLSTLRKSEIVFFDDFSVVTARDDFILGQVARTMLYLSRLRAFVLKCGFDVDFGCWKVDSDGPKMAHLSTLRKSEIVFFDDFSVGTDRVEPEKHRNTLILPKMAQTVPPTFCIQTQIMNRRLRDGA